MNTTLPDRSDPVTLWVLAHERTLRTHPQFTAATLDEIAQAMRAHFAAKRIAPERLGRVTAQPYRELTAGDRERIERAAAKRARRGTR